MICILSTLHVLLPRSTLFPYTTLFRSGAGRPRPPRASREHHGSRGSTTQARAERAGTARPGLLSSQRRRARARAGGADVHGGRRTGGALVRLARGGGEGVDGVRRDQRHRAAAEAGPGHPRAVAAGGGAGRLDDGVERGRGDLEQVAKAGVALVHQPAEGGGVAGPQGRGRGEGPLVLGHDVPCAPQVHGVDPARLEAAMTFIGWMTQAEQNLRWTSAGGLPTQPAVASDPRYADNPMAALSDAMNSTFV